MACKKIEIIVISQNKPLSNQLEKKTGDRYWAGAFEGSTAMGGVLKHKKSGKLFTVLNKTESAALRGQRRKQFLSNVKKANKLCT